MGHFGFELPEGIIGAISTTANSIVRTFIAKEDMAFGEPVQIDHEEPAGSRVIKLYLGSLGSNTPEPLLGVTVYDNTRADGFYKAGDVVSVLTTGDIRVLIDDLTEDIYIGDQVYFGIKPSTPVVNTSLYEFQKMTLSSEKTYGTFVTGAVTGATTSFVINLDMYKTKYQTN